MHIGVTLRQFHSCSKFHECYSNGIARECYRNGNSTTEWMSIHGWMLQKAIPWMDSIHVANAQFHKWNWNANAEAIPIPLMELRICYKNGIHSRNSWNCYRSEIASASALALHVAVTQRQLFALHVGVATPTANGSSVSREIMVSIEKPIGRSIMISSFHEWKRKRKRLQCVLMYVTRMYVKRTHVERTRVTLCVSRNVVRYSCTWNVVRYSCTWNVVRYSCKWNVRLYVTRTHVDRLSSYSYVKRKQLPLRYCYVFMRWCGGIDIWM